MELEVFWCSFSAWCITISAFTSPLLSFFFCISNFYYFFSSFLVRLGVFFSISFAPVCCHDASLHDLLYLAVAIHYTLLSLLLAPAIRNIDAGVYPHFLSTISTVPYLAHCLELHFSYDIPTRSCWTLLFSIFCLHSHMYTTLTANAAYVGWLYVLFFYFDIYLITS